MNEEIYDGFKVVYCPKCKMHFKSYYHDNEKEVDLCPSCSNKSSKVIKDIHKKIKANSKYSIFTENKIFNY